MGDLSNMYNIYIMDLKIIENEFNNNKIKNKKRVQNWFDIFLHEIKSSNYDYIDN